LLKIVNNSGEIQDVYVKYPKPEIAAGTLLKQARIVAVAGKFGNVNTLSEYELVAAA